MTSRAEALRALLFAETDVARDLLPMRARDHRADMGCLICRVAHHKPLCTFGKLAYEIVIDTFLHEDARARRAAFAVDGENGEQ